MGLPLFQLPKKIESDYQPEADVVLFNGDVKDFLAKIPDGTISLIITSPPYNLGKDYETRIEVEKYIERQAEIIKELHRVLKDNGSVCWQVGNFIDDDEVVPLDILYYSVFKGMGFKLRNRIIWHFGHGLHAKKRFSGRYETILWFTKNNRYVFNLDDVRVKSKYPGKRHYKGEKKGQFSGNPLGKNPSDIWETVLNDWEKEVWDIPNVKAHHPEKTEHPCQYPVELVERCILALTNEGDIVLDPFAGTGSTIIGAINRNRKGIGCEKEVKYFNLARNRIEAFLNGSLKIRPLGMPVYLPQNESVAKIPEKWLRDEKTIYYTKSTETKSKSARRKKK